jgi:hypothetical protein
MPTSHQSPGPFHPDPEPKWGGYSGRAGVASSVVSHKHFEVYFELRPALRLQITFPVNLALTTLPGRC